ncbi:MAG: bifunctional riboflavin kinase/FAD synthetase [Alphaproteobacteria bacterium]|nr:bifunctional riboflavin kinase/FAD synthetase [Alphaproteobacteria bacterium]
MQTFATYENLSADARGAVVAIGNFDGVHRGHQALLQAAKTEARKQGRTLGVLTFEPHPRRLFRPDEAPFRLTPPALKAERLAACGVDVLYALPFHWDFASRSAEDFAHTVLRQGLQPATIVVGADFCFGQLRKGTVETLRAAGLSVISLDKVTHDTGDVVSSSAIRSALRRGEIAKANALLGWEWEIRGAVIHGDKRGRELGYPTANIPLGETLHPSYGVYAAQAWIPGEKQWRSAAVNIGIRPMFALSEGLMEAHILDFSGDLYGQTLRVRPLKRLRGEAKFDSLDALVAQIEADCLETRTLLENAAP